MISAAGYGVSSQTRSTQNIPFADGKYVDSSGKVLKAFTGKFVISVTASSDGDSHNVYTSLLVNGSAIFNNSFYDKNYTWKTFTGSHTFAVGDKITFNNWRQYVYSMACCDIYTA